ncbi:MAG TPA: tyrosine-type recombinase/integrase [Candidatus Limnocylindrales bacterium]|nr:tyrosine-type recombinase/integrase [Candidatus Limnocylindrales bacterium]
MSFPYNGAPNLRPGDMPEMRGRALRFDRELPLEMLFEEFLAASASIINDTTEKTYAYDWSYFQAWLAENGVRPVLGSLTRELLVAYIAAQQRRPKRKGSGTLSSHSVHKYTRVIRTFNRWLVSEDYFPTDLLAGGKRGPMPRKGVRVLKLGKIADIETLLDGTEVRARTSLERAARERDQAMIWLVADVGIRTGEAARMTLGLIDLDDESAFVRKAKEDRERWIPLSRETVAHLRLYLRRERPVLSGVPFAATRPEDPLFVSALTGRAMTTNGIYQAMSREYVRGGGTGRFGLHRLRHLFGTSASNGGMDPHVSQLIMGHAGPESQEAYQHPSNEVLREQHARVTPIRQIRPARRRRLA